MPKFVTKDINEKNVFIAKLYNENIPYNYSDKNNEGEFVVFYGNEDVVLGNKTDKGKCKIKNEDVQTSEK